jgi:kynurenine formamidase
MEHHMGKILPGKNTVTDGINIHNHGPQTHVDPPAHVFHNGKVYGGRSIEDVIRPDGLAFGSIHSKREGVVTRGVLLDVPAARGVEWLDPTELVTRDDLDTAERRAGVTVGPGDAAFVRIGVGALNAARGIDDITVRAGLGPDCAVWFHERSVAVACNDGPEKLPLFLPEVGPVWHIAAQVYMGLTSLESPNTERLLEVCREEGRSEFMLMFAPMRIPRGTGSLVNPLCVF